MEDLETARAAYRERAWRGASAAFARADAADPLQPEDLELWAVSAMLLGEAEHCRALRERAFQVALDRGEVLEAARAALWMGGEHMAEGQVGPGSGWLARAARLLAEHGQDCAERGFLRLLRTFEEEAHGRHDQAIALADEAVAAGTRFGDVDLVALALRQRGLLRLDAGQLADGLADLDEAMLSTTAGDVSPLVTGMVYCGVINGCWSIYELRRAQDWTAAMSAWCASQPEMANFRGECQVHRAELTRLRGAWADALEELAQVRPADVDRLAAAAAVYVRGDLDRLGGRYETAGEAFREAARLGLEPQPGLARLRLAAGAPQAAAAMIRRCLVEVHEPRRRVEVLAAAVEILLAVDEVAAASAAADELDAFAARCPSPIAAAVAAEARAHVDLHTGRYEEALPRARAALGSWLEVDAPYQAARARVLLARACRALGDEETAERDLDLARAVFAALGAVPDQAVVDGLRRAGAPAGPLSPRELEVLRLLATGATNRAIAERLVLSERTVDRHVSNIFVKLGVGSRAAATAYAYERGLV